MGSSGEHSIDACIFSGLSVDDFIADHVAFRGSQVVRLDEIQDHLPGRLAALAEVLGIMGTNREIFKRLELIFPHVVLELTVNNVNRFQGKITAAYAGLIGHHKKLVAQLLHELKGLKGILEIFDILHPGQIIFVMDKCTVTI